MIFFILFFPKIDKQILAKKNKEMESNHKPVKKESIGIFVGSFDPPHIGHQNVILSVLNSGIVDHVIMTPTYNNMIKPDLSSFNDRLEMIKLSCRNINNVSISTIERDMKTDNDVDTCNVTSDTLQLFQKAFANSKIYLIMGSDLANTFDTWNNLDKYKGFGLIVVYRQGYIMSDKQINNIAIASTIKKEDIYVLNACEPIQPISSTKIKKLVTEKKIDALMGILDCKVVDYVLNNQSLQEYWSKL